MTFRHSLAVTVLALGLTATGCDTVDNVEPRQSVTPEQALNSVEGFEAILISSYDALQAEDYYGQQFMLVPDALADNITVPNSTSNRYPGFSTNAIGSHLNRWGGHYVSINEMNLVLSRIDALEVEATNPQAVRNRIKGEAKFLRALNYFDLVRTKAYEPGREVNGFTEGVIIREQPTEDVANADFRARSSNAAVYDLVVGDLQEAVSLLTGNSRGSINFATAAAANALLARVELYRGNWAAAESAAQAAIDASGRQIVDASASSAPLVTAFAATSHPESIFEIVNAASQDGAVTNANASLQSLTDPFRGGFFDAAATRSLVNAHEAGDARLDLYENVTFGGEALTYITKYVGAVAQDVDPVPVFRVSEMYLILAEARAEQNNPGGALTALNALRSRRGLSGLSGISGTDIVAAVLRERRVELAFEGHRFFDLKRRGLPIPKPQITATTVIPYADFRVLARIPEDQVSNNALLVQNPGY